ncbi:hypothetical protein P3381_24810 [Vibrio parahaemolyticus]|nr:hypothetical protein [Vibrio parahaemolyticus]
MTATSTALAEERLAQARDATEALTTTSDEIETNIHNGKDWTNLWD